MTYTPAIQKCRNCRHTFIQHKTDPMTGFAGACRIADCPCQEFDKPSRPDIQPESTVTMVPSPPTVLGMTNAQVALLAAASSLPNQYDEDVRVRAEKFETYLDLRDSIRKERGL